jgi:hypothetical protein
MGVVPLALALEAYPMERHVAGEGSRSELGYEGEKLALGYSTWIRLHLRAAPN